MLTEKNIKTPKTLINEYLTSISLALSQFIGRTQRISRNIIMKNIKRYSSCPLYPHTKDIGYIKISPESKTTKDTKENTIITFEKTIVFSLPLFLYRKRK